MMQMMPDKVYGRKARTKISFRAEPYQYDGAQTEYIKASIAVELAEALDIKWAGDKDNMAFKAEIDCYTHDKINAALATYRKAMGE